MAGSATATVQGNTQATAIALSEVSVAFRLGGGGLYTAVERATLNVADGEFVAIVGPTGCGKSTLLNIAAGLIAPSSGRVDIFDSPLAALNRQAITKVFDLRPAAIIEDLDLLRPIYAPTAAYGHFGRTSAQGVENAFTWERTDRVEQLLAAVAS